ncbi:TonB-dependent receptor [Arcicella sp. LKC2W]|uniref:TonB-dependent receptor domain-containing protein n=1 Tax=Arcicella sp. LKC2W TaxID=2984198 RepID=UPI002B20EA2D|nr:TonB-dependent receptor [Arcicella sp. LKC2W]MEA5460823.1 TonB-dependent receptor [Arcicella sp. LKC2W]
MKKNHDLIIQCMKISLVQILLAINFVAFGFAKNAEAQEILNRKISIEANDEKLKNILIQIEKTANVKFFYSPQAIKANQKVSVKCLNESISYTLNKLFMPLNIDYQLSGNQIILKQKEQIIKPIEIWKMSDIEFNSKLSVKQNITGVVVSEKGESLPGVSIQIKGTQQGTRTDLDGRFSIEVPNENAVLIFSFIGYVSQEIKVGNQATIKLTLVEDIASLDEVVVTGVFDKRTRMESSVAISVLNTKQLQMSAPLSAADLLKNIPGIYVNSSLGEIRNTVYSRGVSVGSNDGASGYYYISMQEDGLPVTNATFGNYGPDYYLRSDATLGRLEAVRGGTASILGNNAPGGIFNYVSKTGKKTFEGEIRTKYGLEGDGINPYYRVDANIGGPLNKDKSLTYNIGGFWRQADGARYPGYPMNNGGQIKANIVKQLKGGSLKFYAKFLNDKNAWFEFLPTIGFTDPQLPAGVSQTNSVLIPPVTADVRVNQTNETVHFDSRDKIHSKDLSIGFNFDKTFGDGWTFDNKMRYSDKTSLWNTTAVAYPFAVDNIVWYAIAGQIGQFGNYSFKDLSTGTELANITQAPNIINGQFAGFNFTVNKSNLPGASVQKNSVLFNPLFYQNNNMKEFIEQFSLTKRIKDMSFTFGGFYANSSLHRLSGTGIGVMYSQMTAPRPTPTLISYTGFDGKTYQLTNADGVVGGSGRSAAFNIIDATQNNAALFFGHNWQMNEKLNFDWGLRYENVGVAGTNQIASTVALTNGGTDGNPLTLYDNSEGKITNTYTYDKTVSTFSYSAGLNYKITDSYAIYGRYSNGSKAPDMDVYVNVNSDATQKFLDPIAQKIQQVELGFKTKTSNATLFITPFYSLLNNVANQQSGQETADLSSIYATPVLYNSFETKGIEIEGNLNINKQLSIKGVATFQKSTAVNFRSWILNANGKTDDQVLDFSGNEAGNVPQTMFRVSPTYTNDKLYASLDWTYMGSRQANVPNAFKLPAYTQSNLSLGYNVSSKVSLQGNINNIFNQNGVMGWSAPGGFPAALNRDGFTKAMLEANPNAVYSTVSIPPRAYFLTVSYKF